MTTTLRWIIDARGSFAAAVMVLLVLSGAPSCGGGDDGGEMTCRTTESRFRRGEVEMIDRTVSCDDGSCRKCCVTCRVQEGSCASDCVACGAECTYPPAPDPVVLEEGDDCGFSPSSCPSGLVCRRSDGVHRCLPRGQVGEECVFDGDCAPDLTCAAPTAGGSDTCASSERPLARELEACGQTSECAAGLVCAHLTETVTVCLTPCGSELPQCPDGRDCLASPFDGQQVCLPR